MQFIVALAKKLPWVKIGMFVGTFALGLVWAYIIDPVQFIDATPAYLRADLQEDYMRMAIQSYAVNPDPNLAVERWAGLGAGAEKAYAAVQADPRGLDGAVIQSYGELVKQIIASGGAPQPAAPKSSLARTVVLAVGSLVLIGLLGYAGWYAYKLLGKRGAGVVTTTMQAAEMNRKAEKTDYQKLGLEQPITQTMSTYLLGDDLYDESFSIDTAAGEFLGEYGVGVSEAIGVGQPKKVTALEFWLFDKNDIKTATKVLMSQHAFNDPAIRGRLEPKGELTLIEPQAQVLLETATLQMLVTVIDLEYGGGPLPTNSYFQRVTLELAIWPRQGAAQG